MEITPKRNHPGVKDGTAKPRGYWWEGLEIPVPAGHDTAPLQPPRAVPCSITKPAASHLQHKAPGEGSAGCRG